MPPGAAGCSPRVPAPLGPRLPWERWLPPFPPAAAWAEALGSTIAGVTREIASGRDAHWPGLEQALADVRSGRRAALVAYSPEQLMRDWAHFAAIRDDELAAVLRLWDAAGVTPPNVSDSIEGLTRLIREPAALLLVATIGDQIVGSVIGGWDGWRGNIYRLAVAPEYRRRGIARRLAAEVSRELFAKGATRLSALVEHEHQWAMDFWNSVCDLGYELVVSTQARFAPIYAMSDLTCRATISHRHR